MQPGHRAVDTLASRPHFEHRYRTGYGGRSWANVVTATHPRMVVDVLMVPTKFMSTLKMSESVSSAHPPLTGGGAAIAQQRHTGMAMARTSAFGVAQRATDTAAATAQQRSTKNNAKTQYSGRTIKTRPKDYNAANSLKKVRRKCMKFKCKNLF